MCTQGAPLRASLFRSADERAQPCQALDGIIELHLYDGGYISFDVAEVRLNGDGPLDVRRDGYSPYVSLPNCTTVDDGPQESHGFVLVRSMGITWARPYRWMRCPVY